MALFSLACWAKADQPISDSSVEKSSGTLVLVSGYPYLEILKEQAIKQKIDVSKCEDGYDNCFYELLDDLGTIAPLSIDSHDPARALCRSSKPCLFFGSKVIGQDRSGNRLRVVFISRDGKYSTPKMPYFESWFLVQDGDRLLKKQMLTSAHPAARATSVQIRVSSDTLHMEHSAATSGGSEQYILGVDPLQPIKLIERSIITAKGHGEGYSMTWDWKSFSGNGTSDNLAFWGRRGAGGPFLAIPYVPISFETWNSVSLGNCAADVNAKTGFSLAGTVISSTTTIFRVLAVNDALIVNTYGNHWTHGAASWLYDDHLEVWQGFYYDYGDESPNQWGIRISDGKVFSAYGHSEKELKVQMADGVDAQGIPFRAFRIQLPSRNMQRITVNYSSGDGVKKVNWLLSTSQVKYGIDHTFGLLQYIPQQLETCSPVDGHLEPQPPSQRRDDQPLFWDPYRVNGD